MESTSSDLLGTFLFPWQSQAGGWGDWSDVIGKLSILQQFVYDRLGILHSSIPRPKQPPAPPRTKKRARPPQKMAAAKRKK